MPKFTDAQREVISSAVLDDNHTVDEAVASASRGEFGLPPFTMSRATAHRIVEAERQRRQPLAEIFEDVARRVIRLCERSVAQLEEAPHPLGVEDARRALETANLLHQARELLEEVAEYPEYEEIV